MAQYDINFSTNASQTVKELQSIIASVAKVEKVGGKIVFDLDTSRLSAGIDATFRKLNRQIENSQRVLNKLQIGGPNFQRVAETLGTRQGLRERGRAIAEPIQLRAQSKAFEEGSLVRFSKELQALQIEASQIKPNSQEWVSFQQQIGRIQGELKKADQAAEAIQMRENLGAFSPGSLNSLSAKLKLLKIEADAISPSTKRWKEVNAEIQKTERSIQKVSKKPLSAGQRAGAAGGAFLYGGGMGGGVGSALGGVAGGLAGGVPGAFAGAAIGQVVDNLGTALAGITSQASKVQQLQRGLALASIDAKDFAQAQAAVADVSARLFIPLEQVTKSFSQLRVNTKQYGLSVEETKQILEGTILAVSAFGGSADDVDGAMRAVVQILSKGSVQAEELRGQLGERFPGAVIKFAQANKLSFDELQSRLKEGTIGIKEFVTFAKDNYEDYAEFSKTIATAPEFAGRRLAKALEEMQMAIGQVFGSSGATIQDFASQALKDITTFVVNNKELLAQLGQDFAVVFSGIMSVVAEAGKFIIKVLAPVFSYIGGVIRQLRVMTGAADAATAKAEMNAANIIIQRTGMGRDAYLSGQPRPGSVADKIEFDKAQERYKRAEKRFKDAGGKAALPPETGTPPNLVFGGPGAGMDITAGAADQDKAAKKKQQSLESYDSLQDQLAKNFTQDQLDRMEQEYQARVNRINSEFDLREARANSFQKEAINFERQMSDIGLKRQKALLDASAEVIKAQGSVAGGAGGGARGGGKGLGAGIAQYITGDPASPFYKADHGGGNYHEHLAFVSREAAEEAYRKLTSAGIQVTEFKGKSRVGRHTPGSAHYQGLAFDVPGAQVPMGQEPKLTARVQSILGIGGMGAPRKVTGDEKRDVIADQKAQLAVAQQSLTVRIADAQAIRDAAVAWAQYTAAIVPVEEQALQNDILAKKNELVKASIPEDIIEKEMKYFEAQQKTTLAMENNDKLLAKGTIDQKEHANRLLELKTRLAGYNTELDKNIQLQRQQSFDASMTALNKQMELAGIIDPRAELRARISQEKPGYTPGQVEEEAAAQERIAQLEASRDRIRGIASSIGDAFGTAFKGIITGSMTAQEALAGMFQSIADSFADMVAQMIAEWLKTQILQGFQSIFSAFTGGLGGGLGGGLSSGFSAGASSAIDTSAAGWGAAFNTPLGFASGGIAAGGFTAFANGGMVTGPTMGLVGEGRYNEAIVPLPDGKSIPVDLGGASGSQITSNIVVNVSSDGKTSSSGAGSDSAGLGRKLEGAVKQVIVDELRPGGLLAGRR